MMEPTSSNNRNRISSELMFTKLDACGAIGRTFDIAQENFCTFFLLSSLIFFPAFIAGIVLAVLVYATPTTTNTSSSSSSSSSPYGYDNTPATAFVEEEDDFSFCVIVVVVICLLVPVVNIVVAAMMRATAEIYAGEKPDLGVIQVGVRNVCRLFCFGLISLIPATVLILLGFLLLSIAALIPQSNGDNSIAIILGVVFLPLWLTIWTYIMIPFQMAQPSIVLENITVLGVLSRAWELVDGDRLTIFLATMMLGTINLVVGIIPFVGFFWHFCAVPLSSILATVLYLNLRIKKEGLNRSGLRGELGLDILWDETEMVKSSNKNVFQYESPLDKTISCDDDDDDDDEDNERDQIV